MLAQKLQVIEDSERGMSRVQLMVKYDLKKTTVHDILKAKDKVCTHMCVVFRLR